MDGDDLSLLQWYDTSEEAQRAASVLVEHGIGAVVEPAPDIARFGVALLPGDVARGRELLGLPEPESELVDDENVLRRSNRGLLIPVVVAAAVLLIVPLLAFFISFKLTGG
jgi:hypothetical protein